MGLHGQRVKIVATTNEFAQGDVGKTGVVTGEAPFGMVVVTLDDGRDYWAETSNLQKVEQLVMRERTDNINLETTYCRHCGFNHYENIGVLTCVKCGKDK
jgi:hypothetical protein